MRGFRNMRLSRRTRGGLTVLAYVSYELVSFFRPTLNLREKSTGVMEGTKGSVIKRSTVESVNTTLCGLNTRRMLIINRARYNVTNTSTRTLGRGVLTEKVGRRSVTGCSLTR